MTIRVPDPMNSPQLQLSLQRVQQQYAQYSQQISSGDAITTVGQNPSGSAMILDFQSTINQNTQYLSSINTSMSYLQSASTAATSLGTNVTQLMQLAQEGMSGTQSTTSDQAIVAQVNSIYSSLVNLGNTQVQGKYVFGGSATSTQPFTAPVAPATAIQYNGNNSTINVTVGQNATTPTNIPGDTLFLGGAAPASIGGSGDVFNATQSLATALASGDTAGIQTAYNDLKAINDHVTEAVTQLGSWESGINAQEATLTSINTNLQTVQSSVQSVSMSAAITNLDQASLSQQATLSAMSKMSSQTNLFSLIG
jgi:flagellar hook-associated protein 3 FlgL